MKKKIVAIIIVCAIILLLIPVSYSWYQSSVQTVVVTTTGDIVCNVSLDTDDTYIENNEPYFLINIDNYKTEGNKTVVTSADIDYTLTIENKNGSIGLFRYVDEDGNTNNQGESSVTIKKSIGKEQARQQIKVYVTADTNLETEVDFKVRLDAVQKDMG